MRNTIRTCALITMIYTAAILVNTVGVRSIWADHPILVLVCLIVAVSTWHFINMED
jgi:hypothetical protein